MSENTTYDASSVQQLTYGDISEALTAIEAQVAPLFRRRDWQRRGEQYVRALLAAPAVRRNAENLAAAIEGATPRTFQRFLSDSPWDHRPIIDEVQAMIGPLLQSDEGIWVLNEIPFAKQGEHSVGVDRQASGVHGALQNCQIGLFLAYAAPLLPAFVDMHLYLPHQWTEDAARRRQAGVPDSVPYQSKADLALALLRDARSRGKLSSQWVTSAGEFGQDVVFRDALDAEGYAYLLQVPRKLPIFRTTEWHTQRILSLGNSRRRGSGSTLSCPPSPWTIRELATSIPPSEWKYLAVENATASVEAGQWAARRVWEVRDGKPGREHWLLLRRDHEWGRTSYFVSNAPATIPIEVLVRMSIVGADASTGLAEWQSVVGLDEYEVRSWPGWYHHTSLCLLAGAFLMQHDALCERAVK